jgi:type I restriction enzyme, S subunit
MLSEVSTDNQNLRYDAEYFKKVYLNFFKGVKNLSPLSEFVKNGYRVVYETTEIVNKEEAQKRNYPVFLQATDLQTPFIKTENLFYVHNNDWIRYPKGRIEKGEILIEVKGKAEKVAIVPDDFPEKALVTGSLYKMAVNKKINKHYLLAYLICKYGVVFKERYKTNLLISFISKDDLYKIPVPMLSVGFQSSIESVFDLIFKYQKQSKTLYAQAETSLLNALGLADFSSSTKNTSEESFLASGRLDAEYYQPKYEEILFALKKNHFDSLENLAQTQKGVQARSEDKSDGFLYASIKDCNDHLITTTDRTNQKGIVTIEPNSIVFAITGATIGKTAINHTNEHVAISGDLLGIKPKLISPFYLLAVLSSTLIQSYAKKILQVQQMVIYQLKTF